MISPQTGIVLNIILALTLVVAVFVFIKYRKVKGKAMLPSICLLLVALVNLMGLWFNLLGIITTALTFFLLFIGAYFTKYLPGSRA